MRYIVTKAPGVEGPPIPDDEPCLVIRAQDVLAVHVLEHYLFMYSIQRGMDQRVYNELREYLDTLLEWREINHDKVKVADR